MDLITVQKNTPLILSQREAEIFLTMLVGFLAKGPDSWNNRYDRGRGNLNFTVTNVHAEREMDLIQDVTKSGRFKSEVQLQYAWHVIEQNRATFPNAKKIPPNCFN